MTINQLIDRGKLKNEFKNTPKCLVYYDEEKNYAFVPCGHTSGFLNLNQ